MKIKDKQGMHKLECNALNAKYIELFNKFLEEIKSPLRVSIIELSASFAGCRIILNDSCHNPFWCYTFYSPKMPVQLALHNAFMKFRKVMRPVMKNVMLTSHGLNLVSRRIQGDVTDRIKSELYAEALVKVLGDCEINIITEE